MLPVGEYLGRHPIPKVAGKDAKEKEERPQRKEEGGSLEVELGLSDRFSVGNMPHSGLAGGKRRALFWLGILTERGFGNVQSITRLWRIARV